MTAALLYGRNMYLENCPEIIEIAEGNGLRLFRINGYQGQQKVYFADLMGIEVLLPDPLHTHSY